MGQDPNLRQGPIIMELKIHAVFDCTDQTKLSENIISSR